jgi:uncharacterized protein YjgD (DUF1641 family)
MKSLIDFALNDEYERVKQLGDRLMEIKSVIDWEAFRLIVGEMYENRSERARRQRKTSVKTVYSKNLNPDINRGVGHVLSQQDDL